MLTHSKSLLTLLASSAHICLYVAFILQTARRPLRLIVFQRVLLVRMTKPDGYLQESRSKHLRVSRSFDWSAASYPLDQAPTNAHHAFQVDCGCHTRAPIPISASCVCRGAEARNTPIRRPSCPAREEKRKFRDSKQPTAPPSAKSHVSYRAAHARRREKMAAEGTSLKHDRTIASPVGSCLCC